VTTVGEEKRCNPRFVGRTREQFREFMAKLNLPMPQKIMEALPANEQCGRVTRTAPDAAASSAAQQTRPLTPAQLQAELGRAGTLIIDIREPAEFARAHIAGARSVPSNLLDPAQLPRDQQLVVALRARSALARCRCPRSPPPAAPTLRISRAASRRGRKPGFRSVTDGAAPISIMRQVQIVAGSLIVLGAALGVLVSPWFMLLAGLVGAGLLFAGLLNSCLMTRLLARLPYNRHSVA
jgi:rhodanese-related sulfurtransferase